MLSLDELTIVETNGPSSFSGPDQRLEHSLAASRSHRSLPSSFSFASRRYIWSYTGLVFPKIIFIESEWTRPVSFLLTVVSSSRNNPSCGDNGYFIDESFRESPSMIDLQSDSDSSHHQLSDEWSSDRYSDHSWVDYQSSDLRLYRSYLPQIFDDSLK